MTGKVASDELRALVREALKDYLAAQSPSSSARHDAPGLAQRVRDQLSRTGRAELEVAVRSDADLNAFARDVASLAAHGDVAGALAHGAVRFHLVSGGHADRGEAPGDETAEWTRGVLNERKLVELAKTCRRLVIGPRAVVTPLARDRAREIGLTLVRSRP